MRRSDAAKQSLQTERLCFGLATKSLASSGPSLLIRKTEVRAFLFPPNDQPMRGNIHTQIEVCTGEDDSQLRGRKKMKNLSNWLLNPPTDGPTTTILIRLMAGSVFLWE